MKEPTVPARAAWWQRSSSSGALAGWSDGRRERWLVDSWTLASMDDHQDADDSMPVKSSSSIKRRPTKW
ncbi:hypothetical protein Scep_007167 [Stephania cephalantha]|uniref:Uncharacterized protein n=1 Tax=Stephania cephalantha TaxID=152367 RepID=A0AAP0KC18_9MAGN